MTRLLLLYRSVLGKKAIVAVTGAIMMSFLLLHAAGNVKAFLPDPSPGVPDIDVYARFLRTMGEPLFPYSAVLWLVRTILAVSLVLHVVCVIQLALHNRRARPQSYDRYEHTEATSSARWMLYTGGVLLCFLVVHLLQFTTGTIDASRFVHGEVYGNLYRAFRQWGYVAFYLVAMSVLALHLYHGAWSLFQSLGLDNPDRNRGLRRLALVVALLLPLIFATLPVAFMTGLMDPPPTQIGRLGEEP